MTEIIYPELSYTVQGALYDVYNELRYLDLSEEGWESALLIALEEREVPAQRQVEYELRYKGYRIGRFFVDVLADGKLLLELKVEDSLLPIDVAQVITYLKVTDLRPSATPRVDRRIAVGSLRGTQRVGTRLYAHALPACHPDRATLA